MGLEATQDGLLEQLELFEKPSSYPEARRAKEDSLVKGRCALWEPQVSFNSGEKLDKYMLDLRLGVLFVSHGIE